jgi:hypothetical protein
MDLGVVSQERCKDLFRYKSRLKSSLFWVLHLAREMWKIGTWPYSPIKYLRKHTLKHFQSLNHHKQRKLLLIVLVREWTCMWVAMIVRSSNEYTSIAKCYKHVVRTIAYNNSICRKFVTNINIAATSYSAQVAMEEFILQRWSD